MSPTSIQSEKHSLRLLRQLIQRVLLAPKIPKHIRKRMIEIDDESLNSIRASLLSNYFSNEAPGYSETDEGRRDVDAHMTGRLDWDRQNIIPWLDQLSPLDGANVLEIGCGTGASTVALAEQGSRVTAVDIDRLALRDARVRCQHYGVTADFFDSNATELVRLFSDRHFDLVIFYASLEHMTYDERTKAIANAWELLSAGGLLCVVDTPNRLAYFDAHTSLLPFFYWLPDELAYQYSRFSPRDLFNEAFRDFDADSYEKFMRWGRGMSFHEIQLAIPGVSLDEANCLASYQRRQRLLRWLKWRFSRAYRFQKILRSAAPDISTAFFEPGLNFAIAKNVPR